jgi:hypothetical protein
MSSQGGTISVSPEHPKNAPPAKATEKIAEIKTPRDFFIQNP